MNTTGLESEAYIYFPPDIEVAPLGAYSQREDWRDAPVNIKLFDAFGSWTWYITEYDPTEDIAFGLVKGFDTELGEIYIPELRELTQGPVPRIERDLHWRPLPLGEVMSKEGLSWHLKDS